MNKREKEDSEKSIRDARILRERINRALEAMQRFDEYRKNVKEGEVAFRYDAIVGVLLMARNDVGKMESEWEKELAEK